MPGRMILALLCAFALCFVSVGCSECGDSCPGIHCPGCCNGDCCPCPGGGCPDGVCPLPQQPWTPPSNAGSSEPANEVNADALDEVKSGPDCMNCAPRYPAGPAYPTTPTSPLVLPSSYRQPAEQVEQPRTGAFQCERCKRPTVGDQWQEVWSDDGTPLTFMCRRCWEETNVEQRVAVLENYLKRSGITGGTKRFYALTAMRD